MNGCVLGAEISGLESGGVRDAEDIADVKRAVDGVDVFECFRVPDLYRIVLSANVNPPRRGEINLTFMIASPALENSSDCSSHKNKLSTLPWCPFSVATRWKVSIDQIRISPVWLPA